MTIILTRGSVVWSKEKGAWLIFDTDEAGDYFYDPRHGNDGVPSCYGIAEVGLETLELPARQVHIDAALGTVERYRRAINKTWVYFNTLWAAPSSNKTFLDGFQAALNYVGVRLAETEPRRADDDDE